MARAARATLRKMNARELGERLGVTASTIRARKSRGTRLDRPPQLRLDPAQSARIGKARGSAVEVAEKFGCSPTTVKRLRAKFASKR